jgi:hypothetical protein
MLFASCQNEARWYPSADVEIAHYYEYADTSGPKLAVTLVIHNTGDTAILSSTVTLRVTTNTREYLQTAASAGKIIPGGKVALTVSLAFLEPDEQVNPNGIGIYSSFFD